MVKTAALLLAAGALTGVMAAPASAAPIRECLTHDDFPNQTWAVVCAETLATADTVAGSGSFVFSDRTAAHRLEVQLQRRAAGDPTAGFTVLATATAQGAGSLSARTAEVARDTGAVHRTCTVAVAEVSGKRYSLCGLAE
ncbi:hypothetical protein N8J89_27845 [Crossiella sp. CA-258035]|uniref:hypothetical protein n=1 Tax=Crossiella sp. CA-258035 TaxID=2981138 RepID=UPI0024BCEA50|nr:hypothetical protein [Crossiella sp. CA-258035]WHT16929.1 hypothetical protein N8J89_27845 [Crossiella sp. CA-258035]